MRECAQIVAFVSLFAPTNFLCRGTVQNNKRKVHHEKICVCRSKFQRFDYVYEAYNE